MTIKLSEDNLNQIIDLTKQVPAFGYEIVETLAKDLLRLRVLCEDIIKVKGNSKDLDVYISRLEHALRSKEDANL
mgnify:CR=1 FL=1